MSGSFLPITNVDRVGLPIRSAPLVVTRPDSNDETVEPPANRHLRDPVGAQGVERAGEEAQRAQRGVPVGGGLVEHRAGGRDHVSGDRRDAEEDAAEQVDGGLPPAGAVADRQPAVPAPTV